VAKNRRRPGPHTVAIFEDSREESDNVPLALSAKAAKVPVRGSSFRVIAGSQDRRRDKNREARARMLNAAGGSIASKRDVHHAVRRRRRRRRDRSYVRSMPVQWTFSNSISR